MRYLILVLLLTGCVHRTNPVWETWESYRARESYCLYALRINEETNSLHEIEDISDFEFAWEHARIHGRYQGCMELTEIWRLYE